MKKTLLLLCAGFALAFSNARAETIFALTAGNFIFTFDSATPGTIIRGFDVTGLQSEEVLLGIDFRPFTAGLYGLGSSGRIYLINPVSGAATVVGDGSTFQLTGASFGFDFNPTVDRIRVTSDQDQNLRLNPGTGAALPADTALAYAEGDVNAGANPNVVGSAYTNSVAGATATALYDIDSALDVLVLQNPPNNGTLNTVGPLGVDTTQEVGFDISGATGVAYASLNTAIAVPTEGVGRTNAGLYTINLATGAATLVGPIADAGRLQGNSIIDIAIPTPARLLNLSTRGRVGTGNDVLIAGFISGGVSNTRFLLRAIGPSLPSGQVGTPLPDPVLMLVDNNGTVVKTNDDYGTQDTVNERDAIIATGLTPPNPLESAILADITPGTYTAIVSGKDGANGVALVEIYQLP